MFKELSFDLNDEKKASREQLRQALVKTGFDVKFKHYISNPQDDQALMPYEIMKHLEKSKN